jgi:hypothetical protein
VTSRNLITAHNAAGWLAGAAAATMIGLAGNHWGGRLPGSEPLSVEDVIDATGGLAFGALGLALLRRNRAPGLGRLLVGLAALAGAVWLTGGIADLLAAGGNPSTTAQLLNLLSGALFVPVFVIMIVGPALLIPTGTLPSPRWRPLVWITTTAIVISVLAMLLAPGPIDEDVPGWGNNPLGIPSLGDVTDAVAAAALIALIGCALGAAGAVVVRIVHYRGARRRQVLWFIAGATPMLIGLFTDPGGSQLAQTLSAVIIFGALIGGMGWGLLGGPARALDREQAPMHPQPVPD